MIEQGNERCPWLPVVDEVLDFTGTRRHGADKGFAFYLDALRFAQSQWMAGKPAQAILQLNKAWMADLREGDEWRTDAMDPYRALVWMLGHERRAGYLGNPVRHFQHLASRMSGPRAQVRAWRAWVCLHLAERVVARNDHPRDGVQLAREGLWIPSIGCALAGLARLGWTEEARAVVSLIGR